MSSFFAQLLQLAKRAVWTTHSSWSIQLASLDATFGGGIRPLRGPPLLTCDVAFGHAGSALGLPSAGLASQTWLPPTLYRRHRTCLMASNPLISLVPRLISRIFSHQTWFFKDFFIFYHFPYNSSQIIKIDQKGQITGIKHAQFHFFLSHPLDWYFLLYLLAIYPIILHKMNPILSKIS